jgi:hypothetical protein
MPRSGNNIIMQIFELHFNPKANKDIVFDTFIYEPENLYEKRLGGLYMAGELRSPVLAKPNFLSELSLAIKNEYYNSELKKTPEANFKKSLTAGNEYLRAQTKKGNVGWLGNLNFAVLNYNNSVLNFSKTGDIKIILASQGEFLDIGGNIEGQSEQSDPSRIFGNIASGKLSPKDKVLMATAEAFTALSKNADFLSKLSQTNNERALKEVIKEYKPLLSQASGVCLVMTATENIQPKRALTFKKELPEFSFKKSLVDPLISIKLKKIKLPALKVSALKIPSLPKPKLMLPAPKILSPKPKRKKIKKEPFRLPKITAPDWRSKKLLLVVILALLLTVFFLIFREEKIKEMTTAQDNLQQAAEKVLMAENFLIIRKMEEAENLFHESLDLIVPLTEAHSPVRDEARSLEERIRTQLDSIPQDE